MAPLEDMKRSMLSLYYVVPARTTAWVNDRMRVELQLAGSSEKQKIGALRGRLLRRERAAWAYGQPETADVRTANVSASSAS